MGGWNPHFSEEDSIEFISIVLTGVNENWLDFRMALHLANQRGYLWQVRTRPHDVHDFETVVHAAHLVSLHACSGFSRVPSSSPYLLVSALGRIDLKGCLKSETWKHYYPPSRATTRRRWAVVPPGSG